jgi:TetR/AcrR family transcriptional repressor of lmrAB and yxaGH operons
MPRAAALPSETPPKAPSEAAQAGTRDRLLAAMARALRRRGLHGVGLTELLADAQAPKGVLYHHFPGGKTELAVAAIASTAAKLEGLLDAMIAARPGPLPMLRHWLAQAQQQLQRSGFEHGCPLATVALETTADDTAVRDALAQAFAALRDRLALMFTAAGIAPARARQLAALTLSAYEGALLQARVAGHLQPMADTAAALLALLRAELGD